MGRQNWNLISEFVCLYHDTEVDDVTSSRSFADGGAFLTLPMFYLEGEFLKY